MWYHEKIGGGRCPIVDTWWQTETGGIMISPLPGVTPTKPGSCTFPLPGVVPKIVDEQGEEVPDGEGGLLVMTQPWPHMLRTLHGDHERFKEVYFGKFPGIYFAGDGARKDEDGYYWVLGRVDDVINVSGHRLSTMEVESALVSHDAVAEAAVVGFPHELKGEGICCFVTPKREPSDPEALQKELIAARPHPDRRPGDPGPNPLRRRPPQNPQRQDHAAVTPRHRRGPRNDGGHVDAGGLHRGGELAGGESMSQKSVLAAAVSGQTTGRCALCFSFGGLEESHIIPKGVYRWQKKTAGTPYLRYAEEPNRRAQDGLKMPLLCRACEQRFNDLETPFFNGIFHPHHNCESVGLEYGAYLHDFLTSVSWRVLERHFRAGLDPSFPGKTRRATAAARGHWRRYLSGKVDAPGPHEQHLIPLDIILAAGTPLPPGSRKFLMRVTMVSTRAYGESFYTMAKMGRLLSVGICNPTDDDHWAGSRVEQDQGSTLFNKITVPDWLYDWIVQGTASCRMAGANLSARQRKVIEDQVRRDPARYLDSETFTAQQLEADEG